MGKVIELHPKLNAEVREVLQAPEVVSEFRIIYRRKSWFDRAHEVFLWTVVFTLSAFFVDWLTHFIAILVIK